SVLAALSASAIAQYTNQSEPFYLVLISDDQTFNGQYLAACHTGAAIESLCVAGILSPSKPNNIPPAQFRFNTSDSQPVTQDATPGPSGWITYLLRGSDFTLSQPLGIQFSPTSNVAMPLFYPGDDIAVTVNFDSEGKLNILSAIDDTQDPPVYHLNPVYNWYACSTNYGGYRYVTLNWVVGVGPPQNPTCVKVDVKR
ncbi:uncharacterized protein EI97DRAFT_363951, partial [Westerdykella ornata]